MEPTSSSVGDGPLRGVTIVDVSTTFFGPFATSLLARMGADVIKVEAPRGDPPRYIGPSRSPDMGSVFINANSGKHSVVLDLKRTEGRAVLDRLVETADVFVHNMRAAAAERLSIDAESMRSRHATLIHCTMTGFLPGPYAGRAAYDDVIQGVSGVAAVQGRGGEPAYVVTPMVDKIMGMAGAMAIQAALIRRSSTGVGETVVVPMFEFMAMWTLLEQQSGWLYQPPIGPTGYPRVQSPERRPYPTKDGHLSVLLYTDKQWRSFFEEVGSDDMADDPRFESIKDRTLHTDELYAFVAKQLATRTTAEWLEKFERLQIAAMPVNSVEDLFSDPHLVETGFFQTVEHPTEGTLRLAPLPFRFEHGGNHELRPAPRLGADTREVLKRFGYSDTVIDELISLGAAAQGTEVDVSRP